MTEICYDRVLKYNIKYICMTGEYVSRRMNMKNETIKKRIVCVKGFALMASPLKAYSQLTACMRACVRYPYLRKF